MSHITRYRMHTRIREHFPQPIRGSVLGINGLGVYRDMLDPACRVTETQYPEVDIQRLPYEADSFDFVTCEQTLEHVPDPFQAVRELHRVTRRGRHLVLTTVSAFPEHGEQNAGDYWRFMPDGIRLLLKAWTIEQLENWGGVEAYRTVFNASSAPRRAQVNSANRAAAMRMDNKYPLVIWAIARK